MELIYNGDTNATGHIDNTVIPVWLEHARSPIYRIFNPELSMGGWNTIIKKMEIEYIAQIYLRETVEINSYINTIGNSSFTMEQEVWQGENKTAMGTTVLVYFDYHKQ